MAKRDKIRLVIAIAVWGALGILYVLDLLGRLP